MEYEACERLGREPTKTIQGNDVVWSRYAIKIGDNGKPSDARIVLRMAPGLNDNLEWIYIETNSDPHLVGFVVDGPDDSLDLHVELCDDAREWIEQEAWILEEIVVVD